MRSGRQSVFSFLPTPSVLCYRIFRKQTWWISWDGSSSLEWIQDSTKAIRHLNILLSTQFSVEKRQSKDTQNLDGKKSTSKIKLYHNLGLQHNPIHIYGHTLCTCVHTRILILTTFVYKPGSVSCFFLLSVFSELWTMKYASLVLSQKRSSVSVELNNERINERLI